MNGDRRRAGLAGLVLVLGGCASVAAPSPRANGPSTPATANASPVASGAGATAQLDAALRYRWVREPHVIEGLTTPPIAATVELTARRLDYYASVPASGPLAHVLRSDIDVAGNGVVELELTGDGNGCRQGDRGRYIFTPNETGLGLSIAKLDDACSVRGEALAGDWIRAKCPNGNQWCLGEMDAGPHVSINYEPFVPQPQWRFDYGRFAFTVPSGWLTQEDNADGYVLAQVDGADGSGVFVFSDVLAHPPDPTCPAPMKAVGTSAAAIAAWIRKLPGIQATHVIDDVAVGGLHGVAFDVAVDPTWPGGCPSTKEGRFIPLFINAQSTPEEGLDWGLEPDGRMRLFVLELGPGRTLVIDIEAQDAVRWEALLGQASPIVASFEFRH